MLFKLLLIGHFLGDFFFQPKKIAEGKKENINLFVLHIVIYSVLISLVLLIYEKWWVQIILFFVTFFSHFCIDWVKSRKIEKFFKDNVEGIDFWSFIIDQVLHISILFIYFLVCDRELNIIGISIKNCRLLADFSLSYTLIVNYMLSILILILPTMIFIKKLLTYMFKQKNKKDNSSQNECVDNNQQEKNNSNLAQNENKNSTDEIQIVETANVGAFIGVLERLLILLLGTINLYTSIPIVLTAKSIARFHQLSKQEFAEKYLLGTMVSLIITIIVMLCIF